jgi:hypothetical protein
MLTQRMSLWNSTCYQFNKVSRAMSALLLQNHPITALHTMFWSCSFRERIHTWTITQISNILMNNLPTWSMTAFRTGFKIHSVCNVTIQLTEPNWYVQRSGSCYLVIFFFDNINIISILTSILFYKIFVL